MKFLISSFCLLLVMMAPAYALPEPLKDKQILRGQFTQERYFEGFKKPLISKGTFIVVPNKAVLWSVIDPFSVTTLITPHKLIQSTKGKKIMELSGSRVPFIRSLYSMIGGALVGNWSALESQFVVSKQLSDSWVVTLLPLKEKKKILPFTKIIVKGRKTVEEVFIFKLNDDRDLLLFKNVIIDSVALDKEEIALLKKGGI